MKTFKFQAHFRYSSHGELEKDFYNGEISAVDFSSAEKEIRSKDRRIFKVYEL